MKRSATSYVAPPQHSTENSSGVIRPTYGAIRIRSLVRTRVASSDWCASRNVVSVTSTGTRCRRSCGEGFRTKIKKPLPRALG